MTERTIAREEPRQAPELERREADVNLRPDADVELRHIADYVVGHPIRSELAYETAAACLRDSLACAFLALDFPECTRRIGPVVPGTRVPLGARVPGTSLELDPVRAAWSTGSLIRWLDFNDTWLGAEWGHPSDNLGAILPVADWLGRSADARGRVPVTVRDLLTAMVKAYEIQGVLALENAFNRVGLDHVLLVRVASTAVVTHMLGGGRDEVVGALSHAWIDGSALRTYRHAPNTGPRKSWAAGDAASRAVALALLAVDGEPGCPGALSTPTWGFEHIHLGGQPIRRSRPYESYVIENVLFKIRYPAEFHAQTAVEAAAELHPQVAGRLDEIERIEITTQEPGARIINKQGPLANPADRDHCLQYMVAVALLRGDLVAEDYSDEAAADPRIDRLRERMVVHTDARFTREYLEPDKRSIANALRVVYRDGTSSRQVTVEYPLGHRVRRDEATPHLDRKFEDSLAGRLPRDRAERVLALCHDREALERTPVHELVDLLVM